MPRRLPLLCASNSAGPGSFFVEPCDGAACTWWSKAARECMAGTEGAEAFARWFTTARDARLPPCPIMAQCAWHVAAVRRGEPACYVRRLGLVCSHQAEALLAAGMSQKQVDDMAIWDTFDMADPDDLCWGE